MSNSASVDNRAEATSGRAADYFPIRTVVARTGVTAFTLRAWERRYGLVVPQRSENGQRVYSENDIELIRRILKMVDSGMSIGRVAEALADERADTRNSVSEIWHDLVERMVERIAVFDERGLDDVYQEALAVYPIERVTESLLVPLLQRVGERWLESECGIAEEHFFSVYMRNKLGARFHHRRLPEGGKKLLCACLPGERHEIGQLLFALAAHDRGFRLVLLGSDVPVRAVAAASKRIDADGIVLSGFVEVAQSFWTEELPTLVSLAECGVFLGGPLSLVHRRKIREAGAIDLGADLGLSFHRISEEFKQLDRS